MTSRTFLSNYAQIIQGLELCLEKKLFFPTLVLVYTLIDTLAWADSDKKGEVRARFERWVDKWIDPPLSCTATELYAARCGILHTLTSKADLTAKGKAREVAYAWGNARSEDLQKVIDHYGGGPIVALHVETLVKGVRKAMAQMLEQAEGDPALAQRLKQAAASHLVSEGRQPVSELLGRIPSGV